MKKYRVIITPDAEGDLRAVYRYIRRHSPLLASAWVEGARKAIKTLGEMPERTPLAPEAGSFKEQIRELLYGKGNRGTYRIFTPCCRAKYSCCMFATAPAFPWNLRQKNTIEQHVAFPSAAASLAGAEQMRRW